MSDPVPPTPAPHPTPPPDWVSNLYWRFAKYGSGMGTLIGDVWAFVYKVSGPLALALVLFGHQGCSLPPIPWPTPTPTPGPPTPPEPPGPTPAPTPIPGDGLKVLIVYPKDLSKMPPAQQAALKGQDVRSWLDANTAMGTDGKTHEWRMWEDGMSDADVANEGQRWRDAYKRPRASVPWIEIGGAKDGFEGPLPADAAAITALLEKYKGK